jgi:hypothetical protein
MPTFRIRALSSVVTLGIALASANPSGAQPVNISLRAWREPVQMDTLRQDHELKAGPAAVYEATLKAFADLGIPAGQTDGKRGIIGSERFERMTSFAGAPMSRSFDCGEAPTGSNANSFRLEIAVVAWVAPAGTGTKLGLATIASGRDITGPSRVPKECVSTGSLETKILDRVTKIVGGS